MDATRWTKNCGSVVANVTIVGATHGNELHGIHLVKEVNSVSMSSELRRTFPSLHISGVIGNPAAVKAVGTGAGLRYCDTDLNRCFMQQDLADPNISSIEGKRAKELNLLLGPKCSPSPKSDLILDFHSTTSNTGMLLCCHPQDKLSIQIIAHLQLTHPQLNATLWADSEVPLLPSLARSGITVEVGPISHSTSNAELYLKTKTLLNETLHYLEMHNKWIKEGMPKLKMMLTNAQIYRRFATVGFPRDSDGDITALIHPALQGAPEMSGGTSISSGDPIFKVMADGCDIYYAGNNLEASEKNKSLPKYKIEYAREDTCTEILWPLFINEAAYNEKDTAFMLMRKVTVDVDVLRMPVVSLKSI